MQENEIVKDKQKYFNRLQSQLEKKLNANT